ncbi:MAG TPA: type II toxin-antitoxin system VapC family toxin [Bryobacteraceae bacterium]|nr:type II toxin-antitoxin system VapC family toxin [Bryobacteraceae bacterium]
MYVDSAYLAKVYINEPDSAAVRQMMRDAETRICSAWAIPEVTCVLHRHVREGALSPTEAHVLLRRFLEDIDADVWTLIPVTDALLRRCAYLVSTLPPGVFLRAGDAMHLTTASVYGESEIWTNDRHLLAAARHFNLTGRTVT